MKDENKTTNVQRMTLPWQILDPWSCGTIEPGKRHRSGPPPPCALVQWGSNLEPPYHEMDRLPNENTLTHKKRSCRGSIGKKDQSCRTNKCTNNAVACARRYPTNYLLERSPHDTESRSLRSFCCSNCTTFSSIKSPTRLPRPALTIRGKMTS